MQINLIYLEINYLPSANKQYLRTYPNPQQRDILPLPVDVWPKDLFATFMLLLLLLLLLLLSLLLLLLRLLMTLTMVLSEIRENVIKLEMEKHFSPNSRFVSRWVLFCMTAIVL